MTMTRFSARAATLLLVLAATTVITPAAEASVFSAQPVNEKNFVMVAAPIGSSIRSQLNIYEQVSAQRACFSQHNSSPAVVNPLLINFDFSGICNRYIDSNGYSLRIGNKDLGTRYQLSIEKKDGDVKLVAVPNSGREEEERHVIARAGGEADGFLKLNFEPGWGVRRRHHGDKALGHVYIYRDSETASSPAQSIAQSEQPVQPIIQPAEKETPIVPQPLF